MSQIYSLQSLFDFHLTLFLKLVAHSRAVLPEYLFEIGVNGIVALPSCTKGSQFVDYLSE